MFGSSAGDEITSQWPISSNFSGLQTIRTSSHELVPRGEGNVISVEFNLLYRVRLGVVASARQDLTLHCSGTRPFPSKTRSGSQTMSSVISSPANLPMR